MAQQENSPRSQRDQHFDVFSISGDDVAREQGVSFSPRPDSSTIATMGSVDTVTIGEALEATALSLGDKPVDRKDAAAIQAAETRAIGQCKTGGLAAAAQAAAATNERTVLDEDKVTISDILTDAAEKLPGDKAVTSEDAAAVVGAELRSSPEMKTTPGGVAESISAGARLNQQL